MSMTNEELAGRIQRGEADMLPQLWNRVRAWVCKSALNFYNQWQGRCIASGATVDDLIQEGYFAFCCAVRAYDPAKEYKFIAYLNYPLKNQFKAATGGRGNNKRDPLNLCASLDAPLGEEYKEALVNTVPDENAGEAFKAVEDAIVNSHLREALDKILSALPESRDVIKRRYYGGHTRRQVAEQMGISHDCVRQLEMKGLRELHRHLFYDWQMLSAQDVVDSACRAGGLRRFRDTGYSSVELAYERIETMRAEGRLRPDAHVGLSACRPI